MGKPDYMKYDGRTEEPPYDVCESCNALTAERDEARAQLDEMFKVVEELCRLTEREWCDLWNRPKDALHRRAVAILYPPEAEP